MGDVVNMNVEAVVRAWAGVERDRIAVILAEIEEVRAARAALPDDELSESGEYLALVRLPEIPNSACLFPVQLASTTTTGIVRATGKIVHG